MADLPVPKAEAKPSTSKDLRLPDAVYVAAHAAGLEAHDAAVADGRGSEAEGEALDAVVEAAFRAGRARAAADIRAKVDRWRDSPNVSQVALELLRTAAKIAEGGGEADQSKDHR